MTKHPRPPVTWPGKSFEIQRRVQTFGGLVAPPAVNVHVAPIASRASPAHLGRGQPNFIQRASAVPTFAASASKNVLDAEGAQSATLKLVVVDPSCGKRFEFNKTDEYKRGGKHPEEALLNQGREWIKTLKVGQLRITSINLYTKKNPCNGCTTQIIEFRDEMKNLSDKGPDECKLQYQADVYFIPGEDPQLGHNRRATNQALLKQRGWSVWEGTGDKAKEV